MCVFDPVLQRTDRKNIQKQYDKRGLALFHSAKSLFPYGEKT